MIEIIEMRDLRLRRRLRTVSSGETTWKNQAQYELYPENEEAKRKSKKMMKLEKEDPER